MPEAVAGERAALVRFGQRQPLDALHALTVHREHRGAEPVVEAEEAPQPPGPFAREEDRIARHRHAAQPLPAVGFERVLPAEQHPAPHGRDVVEGGVEIQFRGVDEPAEPLPANLDRLQGASAQVGDEVALPLLPAVLLPPPAAEVAGQ